MVDGPNLFSYVGNDPINFVDPYGLQAIPRQIMLPYVPMPGDNAIINNMDIVVKNKIGLLHNRQKTKNKSTIVTYWQYFTKGWKNFKSPWFVKGIKGKPPYKLGKEARKALNLPPWNKGTAVKSYKPKTKNFVGPRHPKPQPNWDPPINNSGTGWEYYDGINFPD